MGGLSRPPAGGIERLATLDASGQRHQSPNSVRTPGGVSAAM
jgi:hypothetical protein